ncbi:hypothetical protein ACJ6WE_01015 [Streptomyces sp. MMS24-I31]|uniref:hypothetical protein n=1 Tax=Streptomyces sp. MMS24-I31 TaxID=3351563 RepID=UPI003896E6A3
MADGPDARVRISAFHGLACDRCKGDTCAPVPDRVLEPALRHLASDSDPHVRCMAAKLVGRFAHTRCPRHHRPGNIPRPGPEPGRPQEGRLVRTRRDHPRTHRPTRSRVTGHSLRQGQGRSIGDATGRPHGSRRSHGQVLQNDPHATPPKRYRRRLREGCIRRHRRTRTSTKADGSLPATRPPVGHARCRGRRRSSSRPKWTFGALFSLIRAGGSRGDSLSLPTSAGPDAEVACGGQVQLQLLAYPGRFSCQETPKRSLTQPNLALKP